MSEALLPRTHNLVSLSETLESVVAALIEAEAGPLRERAQALVDSCKRFAAAYADGIKDDEADGIAASILAQCLRFTGSKTGRVDAARIALKAPVLAAQQQIDKTFPAIAAPVVTAVAPVTKLSLAFKIAKDEAVRKAAQEEAERNRRVAEGQERLAAAGSDVATFAGAAQSYDAADKARAVVEAKPADLTRTRGSDFGTSSLRYFRKVTITEPHLVPRAYCEPSAALLARAAGKAGSPIPVVAGVVIEDVPELTVRR